MQSCFLGAALIRNFQWFSIPYRMGSRIIRFTEIWAKPIFLDWRLLAYPQPPCAGTEPENSQSLNTPTLVSLSCCFECDALVSGGLSPVKGLMHYSVDILNLRNWWYKQRDWCSKEIDILGLQKSDRWQIEGVFTVWLYVKIQGE